MKKLKVLLSMLLIAVTAAAYAQNVTVQGTVTDAETGETIPGASVLVKGTTVGTVADIDGRFSINAPSSAVLVFSAVGFDSQEIPVNGKTAISCSLKTNAEFLDDAVVVAYGTQSAKTVTASVVSIKADALKDAPNVNFDAMLQGQAAGVQVATPNAGSGQSAKIFIRGISSISGGTDPLYIVDGVPIASTPVNTSYTDVSPLSDINPADILSIEVLKDAAATALYGSRAASGVVLITTKSGRKGEVKVTYDMNIGVATPTKTFDMLDAQSYYEFKNAAVKNRYGTDEVDLGGGKNPWGNKAFNLMKDSKGNVIDTDWSKLIYQNGFIQNHTVAVSGGTDKTTYYVSGNYANQNGIVIGDKYKRAGFKASISTQINKWLKVGINGQYTSSFTESRDGSRIDGVFAAAGLPRQAMILPSILPAYNEDGSYYVNASGQYIDTGGIRIASLGYPNPMTGQENFNNHSSSRVIASGFVEVTPVKNLVLRTQYGIDHMKNEEETFWDPAYGQGAQYPGYSWKTWSKNTEWTWTNTANYNLILGDHSVDFLLGMESNSNSYDIDWINADTILNPLYDGFKAGYEKYAAGGELANKTLVSYFGRINYNYMAKYMLSVNYRRDGLSALGKDNRWGDFYGVSAAWRISEEPFFANLRGVVNELKIKASYGVVGNSEIGYYAAQTYYGDDVYGGKAAVLLSNIGDSALGWEKSTKYDAGFSASFFNRMNVDFDYYYTKSDDLVMAVPQGPSTGIGSLVSNAGALKNSGIELTISGDIIKKRNFTWTSSINFTTVHNEVLSLAEGVDAIYGDSESNITIPGYSMGQLYLYPTGGVDPQTGRRIFYGSNGEKVYFSYLTGWLLEDGTEFLGNLSQVRAGNTIPTYYGGWNNTFRFYGFDLTLNMQFSGGNWIYNGNSATGSDNRWWNSFAEVKTMSWQKPGDNAKYAFPVYGDNISNGSAYDITDWVERGDYLRMKQISLGYTFQTKAKKEKLGFTSVRVFGQVQNAFVITGYSGLDPEITSSYTNDSVASGGYDKNTLPHARTWTLGVQVAF